MSWQNITKASQESVKDAMHEMKKGKLKSGKSGKKVTNPKQAIAIGFQKLMKKGLKHLKKQLQNPHPKNLGQKNQVKMKTT